MHKIDNKLAGTPVFWGEWVVFILKGKFSEKEDLTFR